MEDTTTTTATILVMSKIAAMVGLGFGSLMLGMLPLIVARCRTKNRKTHCRGISSDSTASNSSSSSSAFEPTVATETQGLLTSLLLCFGGGVLLFTTFLHLAPEVRESVEAHQSTGQLPTLGSLSLAELLFCGGFFFVYLVEEAVHAVLTGKLESSDALLYRTVSVRRCNNQTSASSAVNGSTTTVSTTIRSSTTWQDDSYDLEDVCRLERSLNEKCRVRVEGEKPMDKEERPLPTIFVVSGKSSDSKSRKSLESAQKNTQSLELARYPKVEDTEKQHDHHHGILATKNTSIQGLLTVLALSFHAIFEGLAVGLEPSIASVIYLAAAIATHKLVISFCVGMELYVAGASTRTTLGYLMIFSMVTPIGIAVGLTLVHLRNEAGESLGPTPTILQGMAAGTLLYVVFFEVLARERANEKSGLLQLIAIFVGFMLMLGLQLATAHSHSHDGHGHGHSHAHGHEHSHNHSHALEEHALGSEHYLDHDNPRTSYQHGHVHPEGDPQKVIGDAIEIVTDSIAETLSKAFTNASSYLRDDSGAESSLLTDRKKT